MKVLVRRLRPSVGFVVCCAWTVNRISPPLHPCSSVSSKRTPIPACLEAFGSASAQQKYTACSIVLSNLPTDSMLVRTARPERRASSASTGASTLSGNNAGTRPCARSRNSFSTMSMSDPAWARSVPARAGNDARSAALVADRLQHEFGARRVDPTRRSGQPVAGANAAVARGGVAARIHDLNFFRLALNTV